jgi:uncharacterized integral membrane protein (TIGR00698 family)
MRVLMKDLAPGIALSVAVAVLAVISEPLVRLALPIPAMVMALVIGIALNRVASRPVFAPGMIWCVKRLLRFAIGLLGIRIALGDIVDLGLATALLIVVSMVVTVASGVLFARMFGLSSGYGVLAGAATAVCGASAALATAMVVPNYPQKTADISFTVVAANGVSTLVMVLYPVLCLAFGFTSQTTGVMLGATIHDMAQVVGAGYGVSESVGNTAVIVKLFRVFLLLPMVLAIGWWFARSGAEHGKAHVPVPAFALAFLALCLVNSAAQATPGVAAVYAPIKALVILASTWGLLVSIAALGLATSLATILRIGWRHIAVFACTTLVILGVVTIGVSLLP